MKAKLQILFLEKCFDSHNSLMAARIVNKEPKAKNSTGRTSIWLQVYLAPSRALPLCCVHSTSSVRHTEPFQSWYWPTLSSLSLGPFSMHPKWKSHWTTYSSFLMTCEHTVAVPWKTSHVTWLLLSHCTLRLSSKVTFSGKTFLPSSLPPLSF